MDDIDIDHQYSGDKSKEQVKVDNFVNNEESKNENSE